MTWFKVDDHLHSHRKAMRAGTEAMGLWVLAGSWSAAEESDGWVPSYVLGRLVGAAGDDLGERLERAGLWHADVVDGEDGYRFHAWDEYQPTREQLDRKRADQRERMRRARAQGGDVSAHKPSTERAVTPTPTRPDPTPMNTTDADAPAASDHFDAFWSEYPRKIGKAAAAKAYAKATKDTDPAVVLDGLRNAVQVWSASRTEDRFIPHASTWLNGGRWADEVPLPAMPERSPQDTLRAGKTLAQCEGTECPGSKHDWTDRHGRTTYVCMGV